MKHLIFLVFLLFSIPAMASGDVMVGDTTPVTTLKSWFQKGRKPTKAQFAAWLDSYRHLSVALGQGDVLGLIDSIAVLRALAGAGGIADGDKGDVVVTGTGATWTVDNGAINSAKILDGSIALSDLSYTPLTAEVDGSTTNEIQTLDTTSLVGTNLQLSLSSDAEAAKVVDLSSLNNLDNATGTAATVQIEDNAISDAKLAHGTANTLRGFDATGVPGEVSAGANITISAGVISSNAVTGTGTTNYLPKWSSSTGLVDSKLRDDGTTIGLGGAPSANHLIRGYGLFGKNGSAFGNLYEVYDNPTNNQNVMSSNSANEKFGLIAVAKNPDGSVTRLKSFAAFGGIGAIGVGPSYTSGGRSSAGLYGSSSANEPMGVGSSNFNYGGYFLSEGQSGCTDYKGSMWGSFSKADISAAVLETPFGSVYGMEAVGIGKSGQTVMGGRFSASGGTTNYGLYSASGNNYFANNVGIAKTAPAEKLDVTGNIRTSGQIQFGGSTTYINLSGSDLYSVTPAAAGIGQNAEGGIVEHHMKAGTNVFGGITGVNVGTFTGGVSVGSAVVSTVAPTNGLLVDGEVKSNTVNAATTDTDKFLVSDGGTIKYRTGGQAVADMDFVSSPWGVAMTVSSNVDTLINTTSDGGYFSNVKTSGADIYTISYYFDVAFYDTGSGNNVFSIPLSTLGITYGVGEEDFIIGTGSVFPTGTINSTNVQLKVLDVRADVTDEEIEVVIWRPASLGSTNNRGRVKIVLQTIK